MRALHWWHLVFARWDILMTFAWCLPYILPQLWMCERTFMLTRNCQDSMIYFLVPQYNKLQYRVGNKLRQPRCDWIQKWAQSEKMIKVILLFSFRLLQFKKYVVHKSILLRHLVVPERWFFRIPVGCESYYDLIFNIWLFLSLQPWWLKCWIFYNLWRCNSGGFTASISFSAFGCSRKYN